MFTKRRNSSARTSARICGLHDRRYAQRLFKKYFGVSMQRCRQLGSGISLYHENPWKREHMESDIYETADSE